jgi:hypothetical protein
MTESTVATTDLTKAELTLALSKEGLAYQDLLQQAENVIFTKDNLNGERNALVSLRKVKSKLDAMQNPFTERWKGWNESRKSLVDPVAAVLQKKEGEFRKLANEIAEENRKAEAENQRKAGILAEIDSFFINQSQAIAAAQSPEELVRIEKLIGSHKGNSSRYQEYLPTMAEKAEILAQLIKTQKDAIKKIADLRAKEVAAMQSGNDEAVLELREKQEEITATIEQGKIDVQESAISMATKADVVEPEVILPAAPKARRSSWTWDVVNIKETQKKMPSWVVLTVDIPKVDEYLRAKKAEGFDGEEFEFAGVRFWLKKDY